MAERSTGGGYTLLRCLRSSPPLALRAAAGSVWLVGSAAGPLAGDRLRLVVSVGAGASLTVRSTAAMVVLGGSSVDESSLEVDVEVGPGAELRWLPEPTVATAGCRHRSTASVRLGAGAKLVWREELVLGRSGEGPGRFTSRLDVSGEGGILLRQAVTVGDGAPGWAGPAVLDGAKAGGTLLVVDPGLVVRPAPSLGHHAAVMPLAGGGAVVIAAAPGASALRLTLDQGAAALGGR